VRAATTVIACFLLLAPSRGAAAQVEDRRQEWAEFVSLDDGFSVNFPGTPTTTTTTYHSQFGADLPARVYKAALGPSRFSLTVVDYRPIEKILSDKAKSCPPGAETCLGGFGSTGPGYSWADRAGAMIYATWQFMQRDARITQYVWSNIDQVIGHMLHLTNNSDQSRTYVGIFMHQDRLYISEGTVPAGYPEPGLFQQSLGWVDEKGTSIRYQSHYMNGFPPPPRVR
jgi:hypothetical protein